MLYKRMQRTVVVEWREQELAKLVVEVELTHINRTRGGVKDAVFYAAARKRLIDVGIDYRVLREATCRVTE